MSPRLCKLILQLFGITLLAACAPQSVPSTPTSLPEAAAPTLPPIGPTSAVDPLPTAGVLPTVSFESPLTAIPTIAVESPFEFVAALDEYLPGSEEVYFWQSADGRIWMITDKGIARLDDSGWAAYLSDAQGYFVGIDSNGRAWYINATLIVPAGGGAGHSSMDSISAWDGTQWTRYGSESGWTAYSIDPPRGASLADLQGQIWVSTLRDLRLFDGSRWKVIQPEEIGFTSSPALQVNSIAGAHEIWVTGCDFTASQPRGSKIIRYDGSTWENEYLPDESGCLSTLPVEHQGQVWMAMQDSLWGFAHGTKEWTQYPLTQIPSAYVVSLAFNEAGEPWLISLTCDSQSGCTGSTLYHLQNDIWVPIRPQDPGIWFSSLLIDSADRVWASARDGIYQIVNDQPHLVSNLVVSAWTMDQAGRIWAVGRDPSAENRLSLWVSNP